MSKTCQVCSSPSRRAIDAMLASKDSREEDRSSPRLISRCFPRFSRRQIESHRVKCLGRNALAAHLLRTGTLSEEDFAEILISKTELSEQDAREAATAFAKHVTEAS